MRNRGLRRPGLNAMICVAMVLGGGVAIWSGVTEMNALGHETTFSALTIALGLLVAIFGFLFFFNFLWAVRVVSALRRGDGVIARWTVPATTFDRFRDIDRRLGAADNDYRLPRRTPAKGVDVIFSRDGVLVGDTFFGLSSTGLGRFNGVRSCPRTRYASSSARCSRRSPMCRPRGSTILLACFAFLSPGPRRKTQRR